LLFYLKWRELTNNSVKL